MKSLNQYLAEAVGTFSLVFVGTGSIVVNDLFYGAVSHVGISLVFGLIVVAMIYSIGNISGAHINPAVTIGFFVARGFPLIKTVWYIVFQFAGAIAASLLLKLIFSSHASLGGTVPSGSWVQAFVLEIILTFILMFVILNVSTGAKEKGVMAGVAIGGTVGLMALFAGPVCGASMNPARSLAPALVSLQLSTVWIYLIAPVLGAVLASPFCRLIQGDTCCSNNGEE